VLGRSRRQLAAALLCGAAAVGTATGATAFGGGQAPTTPSRRPAGGAYARAVLADRPVGYWRFDDAPASRKARPAAGQIAGTYVRTRTVAGVAGSARAFDGRSSFVAIASSPAWSQSTTGRLTVEFWLRPDALEFPREEGSGYVWILGKGEPGRQEWAFRMYGRNNTEDPPRGNRISFYAYSPSGGQGAGAYFQDDVVPGRWIYVVGELTPTGVKIYRDAVLRQGPPAPATLYGNPAYNVHPAHGSAPLRVGTRDFHSFFEGAVDELALYPYLLSQAQIRRHYAVALRANPALG
jgi:hypothetical protein